jgi:hypothetical protein
VRKTGVAGLTGGAGGGGLCYSGAIFVWGTTVMMWLWG